MLYKVKRQAATAWFGLNAGKIFQTPPLDCDSGSNAVFVSQVCHRDLAMYLLAVKSLGQFVRPKTVFIVDDTSLTLTDKEILRHHIQPLEIIPTTTIDNTVCPIGGCWERLLFISDCVSMAYVVQLDSDTLTIKTPAIVMDHISKNLSFTLGEWRGQNIGCARDAAKSVSHLVKEGNDHVQLVSESKLQQLNYDKELRYVRGNAGFAGFAKGSFSRCLVERFSKEMANLIGGKKWSEWGSEQVTSNFVVANSPNAQVLPFPEYCFHTPDADVETATFIHFIGSYRFNGGRYGRLARRVIQQLQES